MKWSHLITKLKFRVNYALYPTRVDLISTGPPLGESDVIRPDEQTDLEGIRVGIARDYDSYPYWPKFERFLKNNQIDHGFVDIHSDAWLEQAKAYDVLLWRPQSTPWELEEAREKIYILEKLFQKKVLPSFDGILFYENKTLQSEVLQELGFPAIPTFVSYNYTEARTYVESARYPFVSKLRTGSGSMGTMLMENKRQARRYVEKVFRRGKSIYWPSIRQKDYVFFQDFVENKGFDVRVIYIDDEHIYGYHRLVPKGDFRASGMNLISHQELPVEAVKIARDLARHMGFPMLAVDFLQASEDDSFHIIETSLFIAVDKPWNLTINDIHGTYHFHPKDESLEFVVCDHWLPEIILKRFLDMHYSVSKQTQNVNP